jgi:hypothetical protein
MGLTKHRYGWIPVTIAALVPGLSDRTLADTQALPVRVVVVTTFEVVEDTGHAVGSIVVDQLASHWALYESRPPFAIEGRK